ncbi:Hypothetical predicted protein [Mytilus galloprovincialis]|uniref:Uncharacterized protein n=1 Tax=Mytilus galloprovincialis TaxID=29158 RepID=A0A8B6C163_MYTGA|nr:Hypothetical predicted protein [Mytilus galloprovincialis]
MDYSSALAVDNGVVFDVEESVEQQTSTNAERGTVLSTRMSGVRYKHEGDKIVRKVNRHNIDKNQSLFKQPRALTIPFTDGEDDDNNENEESLVADTDYKEI